MQINAECVYDYKTCRAIAHVVSYKKQKPVKALILHMILISIFIFADVFVIMTGDSSSSNIMILLLGVFVILMELVMYFLLPKLQYRSMAKMKDLGNHYVFRQDDFVATTQSDDFNGDSVIKYSFLEKVIETKEYLFIFTNKRQIMAVDKSTINENDSEKIRTAVSSVLGKKYIVCKY